MTLSVRSLAFTTSLLWAGAILLVGLVNLVSPAYGKAFLELCSSIYPGYHATPSFGSVIVGALYGLVDGAIGGALFAWLYNLFARKAG